MNSTIAPQGCQTPRIREYLYLLTTVIAGETHTGDESVAKSPPFLKNTCRQRIAAIPVDFRGLEQREHVRNVQARHRCAPGKPFVGGDQVVGLDALGGGEHRAVQYSAASSAAASCTIRTVLLTDLVSSAALVAVTTTVPVAFAVNSTAVSPLRPASVRISMLSRSPA